MNEFLRQQRAQALESGEQWACADKIKYGTMEVATVEAYRTTERWRGEREYEPYSCPFCDRYHVGRRNTRRRPV